MISLPVPVSPSISTVESLSAICGSTAKIFFIKRLRLTMSPWRKLPLSSRRSSSTTVLSRKVSTPPRISPALLRSGAVETLIGTRFLSLVMM